MLRPVVWRPLRVEHMNCCVFSDEGEPAKAAAMTSDNKSLADTASHADFRQVFEELRPAMFALAYRITGSSADAEDIVQDAFLRFHNSAPDEAIRSFKAYLATITARLSLNRLRDQRARRETYVGEWLPEPLLTQESPTSLAEDLSFALLVVLERLSPVERVAFILKSAFDFSFEEIAPIVGRNPVACRKLYSRGRARILEDRPRFPVDRERHRALLRSFEAAARGDDLTTLLELLSEGVVLHGDGGGKALGLKKPLVGAMVVARFVIALSHRLPADVQLHEMELNGAPAISFSSQGRPFVVIMIETEEGRIRHIYAIANPDKISAVGALLRLGDHAVQTGSTTSLHA
jgi:RNA polymerase sigma-70 factor, ECF subfamily